MSETKLERLPSLNTTSIEDFVLSANPECVRRETFLVPVEEIVLAENIRPFDYEFINVLKENIKEQGQLQECIGDIVTDENGDFKIRVIAGQHRETAIQLINEEGIRMPVRVSVADRMLPPEVVIEIQMSENLQNKMTSAQDAFIIHNFWRRLTEIRSITKAELARKVGRSVETVSNSIKYIEDVNPVVQKMVDEKILHYSLAVLLSEIEKGNGYESKQVSLALLFISKSYTLVQAEKHIKQLKTEQEFVGPLFGGDNWDLMEIQNNLLAIRNESDRKGKEAAGWFVRMVRAAKILNEPDKVRLSNAIKKAVSGLGMSLDDFKKTIKPFVKESDYIDAFGKD